MRFFRLSCFLFAALIFVGAIAQETTPKSVLEAKNSDETIKAILNQKPSHRTHVAHHLIAADEKRQPSVFDQRLQSEEKIIDDPFTILLYEPTYVLPFYYTGSPDQAAYQGETPLNQPLMHAEFKGQFSILLPVFKNIFGSKNSIYAAYTQLSYWQVYAESQYFRETDYQPEIFISHPLNRNWLVNGGIVHQSNGLGGDMERTWNRVYGDFIFSEGHWLVSIKPWLLVFQGQSSDLHNPDIAHYLGYGRLLVAYKTHENTFSLILRNEIESGFKRGAAIASWSFPLYGRWKGYFQYFTGYGQSLIEYNHRTNSGGIGIAVNDWL